MKLKKYFILILFFYSCKSSSTQAILFDFKFGMKTNDYKAIIANNINHGTIKELDKNYDHYSTILKLPTVEYPVAIWLNPNDGKNELDSLTEIQIDIGTDVYEGSLPIKSLSKSTGAIRRTLVDSILADLIKIYGQPDELEQKYARACKGFLLSSIIAASIGADVGPNNPLTKEQLKEKAKQISLDESDINEYYKELETLRMDRYTSKVYYWTRLKSFQIVFEKNTCIEDSLNYVDTRINIKGK